MGGERVPEPRMSAQHAIQYLNRYLTTVIGAEDWEIAALGVYGWRGMPWLNPTYSLRTSMAAVTASA